MGKDNRARRKAKVKNKAKAQGRAQARDRADQPGARGRSSDGGGASGQRRTGAGEAPPFVDVDVAVELLALHAQEDLDDGRVRRGLEMLASMPAQVVDAASERVWTHIVDALWTGGWQPSELVRQGRRATASLAAARLVALAIAVDHAGRRASTLDNRWLAQVQSLDLPATTGRPGWMRAWREAEGLDRAAASEVLVDALRSVFRVPPMAEVLPPPGSARRATPQTGTEGTAGVESDPVLDRIRALLAKAESSAFDAEAQAFTAKAQELMTRHAVDAARVRSDAGDPGRLPVLVRLPIDSPYADAKSVLLQVVAGANRTRSIFHPSVGLSTLVGMEDDVSATEVLFTSLLIQAQAALADAARRATPGSRPRSQAFRSSFLLAYAGRIGERLTETNAAVLAEEEADHGSSFLPVLRSEAEVIDAEVDDRFGELVSSRVRGGHDPRGHASGRAAGDRAKLDGGALPDEV